MRKSLREAIDAHVGHVVSAVTVEASRLAAGVSDRPDNMKQASLHHTFYVLTSNLVPEVEKSIVDYCVEVGVRDSDVIAKFVADAMDHLGRSGNGLAAAHQAGQPGMAMREALQFEAHMKSRAAGASSRARIAIEKQRPRDPTYFDQIVRRVKDNRVGAWILVLAVLSGGFTLSATLKEGALFLWRKVSFTRPTSPAPPVTPAAPHAPGTDARPDR
jgi:hypothetical protein